MSILKFERNTTGRDFVVGDIHGCYGLLMIELRRIGFDKATDRLFSVGDLVDRGPDSFKCLSLPFEPWFFAVRGNHEEMMLSALAGDSKMLDVWLLNGGTWVYEETPFEVQDIALAALKKMPYAIEVEVGSKRIGIVHAEVTNNDWSAFERGDFCSEAATWARKRISTSDAAQINGIDLIVSGHTITDKPRQLGNQLYIDTGAFRTQRLTILELGEVAA